MINKINENNSINQKDDPKVSVMIIIYDVEDYLIRCLESVIKQTYRNLEILLIVGDSGDRCTEICYEYMDKDDRVKIIDGQNHGRGIARNAGLKKASGDYLVFMDGDDWMDSQMIELLLDSLIKNDLDIMACNYEKMDVSGQDKGLNDKKSKDYIEFDGIEATKRIWYADSFNIAPWGKVFKREIWNGIEFRDYAHFDDVAIVHKAYIRAHKFGYDPNYVGMNYLVRKDSATRKFDDGKLVAIKIAKDNLKYAKETNPILLPAAKARAEALWFHILCQLPNDRKFVDVKRDIWCSIKEYRRDVIKDKRVRKKTRFALLLSYLGLRGFIAFYSFCFNREKDK